MVRKSSGPALSVGCHGSLVRIMALGKRCVGRWPGLHSLQRCTDGCVCCLNPQHVLLAQHVVAPWRGRENPLTVCLRDMIDARLSVCFSTLQAVRRGPVESGTAHRTERDSHRAGCDGVHSSQAECRGRRWSRPLLGAFGALRVRSHRWVSMRQRHSLRLGHNAWQRLLYSCSCIGFCTQARVLTLQ